MTYPRRDLLNPTLEKIFKTFILDKDYIKGKGSYLTDSEGTHYLDFIAQYGAIPFGYNPDFIWDRLDEVRRAALPSFVQPSIPVEAIKLANALAQCTPGDLSYCTFCQSGTEAVEAAIKLARSTTGKELIVSTENSFHGKTLASLSATGKDSYQTPFRAPAPGFLRIPFNDLDSLQKVFAQHGENIAGFIVEPLQGEGGIITAKKGYLPAVQKLCNDYNIIFIVDEIQTGLGRTGTLFACEEENVEPDIMLLAKALGGGILPLGVCISSPRIWNEDYAMLHSSTFANNNITCAVGLAVLEQLAENRQELIKEVAQKGDYLLQKTAELAQKYPTVIKEARGRGLMVGLEFHNLEDCGAYDMAFLVNQGGFTILLVGFLLNVYHIRLAPYLNDSMTLRLEPTLTISYEEINYVIDALDDVCKILEYQDYSKLNRYLLGDNSRPQNIVDYRPISRKIKPSKLDHGETVDTKFAFIIHYPAPEDIILNNPSFASYTKKEMYEFLEWESSITDPGLVCHMPAVRSKDGTVVEGWLIGVPFGGKEIMNLPRDEVVDSIKQAVDMGRDLGAGIVGLGALTSVVTRGGRSVTGRDVAITSGNSFTTLMAIEALFLGAQKMKIDLRTAIGGVVGATGSIGRACALMLSEQVAQIILFGNPRHVKSSRNRLNSLASDIYTYAKQRRQNGYIEGMSLWLDSLLDMLAKDENVMAGDYLGRIMAAESVEMELIDDICKYLAIDNPISISIDIPDKLPLCDLIIATSNSPEYLIYPENLQTGAVVCDVARPADVAPEVIEQRADVLVLEGGLVQLPDDIRFGPNLGYRDGVNLACLSETMLLAMEGDFQDYSIGNILKLETVQYFRILAQKHGFKLAGLKMGNQELTDKDIDKIYRNSIGLKMVGNI